MGNLTHLTSEKNACLFKNKLLTLKYLHKFLASIE